MKKWMILLLIIFLISMTACEREMPDGEYCYVNYTNITGDIKRDKMDLATLRLWILRDKPEHEDINIYLDQEYTISFEYSDCKDGIDVYAKFTAKEEKIYILTYTTYDTEIKNYFMSHDSIVYTTTDDRIMIYFNLYNQDTIILDYTNYFMLEDDEELIDVSNDQNFIFFLTSKGNLFRTLERPSIDTIISNNESLPRLVLIASNVASITHRINDYQDYLTEDGEIYVYNPILDEYLPYLAVIETTTNKNIIDMILKDGIYFTDTQGQLFFLEINNRKSNTNLLDDSYLTSDNRIEIKQISKTISYDIRLQELDNDNKYTAYSNQVLYLKEGNYVEYSYNNTMFTEGEYLTNYEENSVFTLISTNKDSYITNNDYLNIPSDYIALSQLLAEGNHIIKEAHIITDTFYADNSKYSYILVITENNELFVSSNIARENSFSNITLDKIDIDITNQEILQVTYDSYINRYTLYLLQDNGQIIEISFDSKTREVTISEKKATIISQEEFVYHFDDSQDVISDLEKKYGLNNLYQTDYFKEEIDRNAILTMFEPRYLYYEKSK